MKPQLKTTYEGESRYGENQHLTKKEEGTLPLIVAAQILGKKGERRDWHYEGSERYFGNYPEEQWKELVEDVKKRGILKPIFIVVEWVGGKPKAFIYEGNHRVKAATQAGLDIIPVEVRYFGHAEDEFEWPTRHLNKRYQAKMTTQFKKPTPEMVDHFKTRTQEHINRVIKHMRKLQDFPGLEPSELAERAKLHDEDKYKDKDLVLPYIWITEYYRVKNDEGEVPDELQAQYDLASDASEKHIHRNVHHPEAYSSPEDMTLLDLAEMVCDWSAMAEELGEGSAKGWADKNVGTKWKFSPEQEEIIYKLIDHVDGKVKQAATNTFDVIELSPFARRTHYYESSDQVSDCQGAEIYLEELMYEFPFLDKLDEIHSLIRDEKGVGDGACIELAQKANDLVDKVIEKNAMAKYREAEEDYNLKGQYPYLLLGRENGTQTWEVILGEYDLNALKSIMLEYVQGNPDWEFSVYEDPTYEKGQPTMAKGNSTPFVVNRGKNFNKGPYTIENEELAVHTTARDEEEAHDEATILAEQYPGYKFKIYKGSKLIGSVVWNRGSFEVTTAKMRKAMKPENEIGEAIAYMLNLKRGPAVWQTAMAITDEYFEWDKNADYEDTMIAVDGSPYEAIVPEDEVIEFYKRGKLIARVNPYGVDYPPSAIMAKNKKANRQSVRPADVWVANIDWCDNFGDDAPLVEIYAVSEEELKQRVKFVRSSIIMDAVEDYDQHPYYMNEALCDETSIFTWDKLVSDYLAYSSEDFIEDLVANLDRYGHFINWP